MGKILEPRYEKTILVVDDDAAIIGVCFWLSGEKL
jgi:hypothetical protein